MDPTRQAQALLEQLKARPAPEKQAEILVALGDLQTAPLEAALYYVKSVNAAPQRPQQPLARLARLARQTGEARIVDALIEGLTTAGRFEDVAVVLKRQAEAAADERARARYLISAARVAELHLSDPDAGRAHLEGLSEDPKARLRHLMDYLARNPQDFGGVRALSRALARFDPEGAVALLTKAAEDAGGARAQLRFAAGHIAVKQLGAPLRALSHLFEVLSIDRGYLDRALPLIDEILREWGGERDVTDSLQALFERLGQPDRVHHVLLTRLEHARAAERPAALLALARHAEYQLLDSEQAFKLYRQGLEGGAGDLGAFAAGMRRVGAEGVEGAFEVMRDLFERLELWRALVNVLDDEAALQVDDPARAKLCWRAGVILEDKLEDRAGAMGHYIKAFKLEPKEPRYIEAGERLYRQRGDWPMAARLLRMRLGLCKDAQARQALKLDLAEISGLHLGDPIAAYEALREVRAEGGEVDEALRRLLSEDGRMAAVEDHIEATLGEATPEEGVRRLLELARLRFEFSAEPRAGLSALKRASALAPGDERLFHRVEQALADHGVPAEVAEHLATAADRPLPAATRLSALRRAATLLRDQLSSPGEALDALVAARGLAVEDEGLWVELLELAEETGPERLIPLLEEAIEINAMGPERRDLDRASLVEAYERVGRMKEAARVRIARLEASPYDVGLFEETAAALRAVDDRPALMRVYALHLEAAERPLRRIELAEMLAEAGELRRAAVTLEPALDTLESPDVLERLRHLYAASEDREAQIGLARLDLRQAKGPAARLDKAEALVALAERAPVDEASLIFGLEALAEAAPTSARYARLVEALGERDAAARLDALEAWLGLSPEDADVQRMLARALDEVGEEERAIAAWERLLRRAPEDIEALDALIAPRRARGDWAALLDLLERRAALDAAAAPPLLAEAATIAGRRLEDAAVARRLWEGLLHTEVGDEAFEALLKIYRAEGEPEAEARLIEGHSSPEPIHLHRLATLYSDRLAREADAARVWRRILALDPRDEGAWRGLLSAARAQGDEQGTLEALEALCPLVGEVTRLDLRVEAATLIERRRGPEAAREAWRALSGFEAYERRAWAEILRLSDALDDAAAALEALRALIPRSAAPQPRVELLKDLARRLDDADVIGIRRAWQGALDLIPEEPEALRALATIDSARGDLPALRESLDALWVNQPDPQSQLEHLLWSAERLEEAGAGGEELFECFLGALKLSPAPRLEILEGLDRWMTPKNEARLDKTLRAFAARAVDAKVKSMLDLRRAAFIPDRAEAQALAREAFARAPLEAIDGLEVLAHRLEEWGLIIEAWTRLGDGLAPAHLRGGFLVKAAEAAERHARDPRGAFALWRRAALAGVAEADEALLRLAEHHHLWPELIADHSERRALITHKRGQLELLEALAEALEGRAKDPEAAFEQRLIALQIDPEDERAREGAWRLAGRLEAWPIVAGALSKIVERTEEPWLRLKRLHELAEVQRVQLNAPKRALETLQRAWALSPWHERTLAALDALAARGQRRALAGFFEAAAEGAVDDYARARCLKRAADLLKEEGDHGGAARLLQLRVEQSGDLEVFEELLASRKAAADPVALATTLEAMTPKVEPPRRAAILRERVALYRGPLRRLDAAVDALDALLALHPGDEALEDELLDVLAEQGSSRALDARLEGLIEAAEGPRRFALLRRRAQHLERRGLKREAFACWVAMAESRPEDKALFEALLARYEAAESASAFVRYAERCAEVAPDTWAVEVFVAIGRAALRHLDDERRARRWLMRAHLAHPHDVPLARELSTLLHKRARWRELIELYERVGPAFFAQPGDDEAEGLAEIRLALERADLEAERLYKIDEGIATLRAALERWPEHRGLLERLLGLLQRVHDGAGVEEIVGRLAAQSELAAAQQIRARGAEALMEMRDAPRAVSLWKAILEHQPSHAGALKALGQLAERRKDWPLKIFHLESLIRASGDARGRIAHLKQLGQLYLGPLADKPKALRAFERALALAPQDPEALCACAELSEAVDQVEAAERYTQRLIDLAQTLDEEARAEAIPQLATRILSRVEAHREGDKVQALLYLTEGHTLLPKVPQIGHALADLLLERGDLRAAAVVYEKFGLPVPPPTVRAEPFRAHEHIKRARAFYAVEAYDKAVHHFEAAAHWHETQLEALTALAYIQAYASRWEAAVRARIRLAQTLADPREAAGAFFMAGRLVEVELGKLKRAVTIYERALGAGLEDRAALITILKALLKAGRARSARALLERLRTEAPEGEAEPELGILDGVLMAQVGEQEAAYDAWVELASARPERITTLLQVLDELGQVGRTDLTELRERLEARFGVKAEAPRGPSVANPPPYQPEGLEEGKDTGAFELSPEEEGRLEPVSGAPQDTPTLNSARAPEAAASVEALDQSLSSPGIIDPLQEVYASGEHPGLASEEFGSIDALPLTRSAPGLRAREADFEAPEPTLDDGSIAEEVDLIEDFELLEEVEEVEDFELIDDFELIEE